MEFVRCASLAAYELHERRPRICQYDAPPNEALAAVRAHQGPLLVDVDETLYLRNFNRGFHRLAWPGLFGVTVLRVLDVLNHGG